MDCIDILRQGAGRDLNENELVELMERVKIERAKLAIAGEPDIEAALKQALKDGTNEIRVRELAKMRAKALDSARLTENLDYILNTWGDRPWDGLDALVSGSSHSRIGGRDSIEARQNSLSQSYLGGFHADIYALGHTKLFNTGSLDLDVARALWSIDDPAARYSGPPEALEIAKVMRKWQHKAVDQANEAGAYIRKRADYIVQQNHDRARIHKAGFEQWKKDILPELDLDRTLDPDGGAREALQGEVATRRDRQREITNRIQELRKERENTVQEYHNAIATDRAEMRQLRRNEPGRERLKQSIEAKHQGLQDIREQYRQEILDLQKEYMGSRKELRELDSLTKLARPKKTKVDDFLYHVWQGLQSGEHLKYSQEAKSYNPAVGAAARRLSHERVLHFKDADGWYRYNEKDGKGNRHEAFAHGLEKQARTTALMQVLGPSGSDNWEELLLELKKHYLKNRMQKQLDNLQQAKAFNRGEAVLRHRLVEVDGSLNIPGSDILAGAGTIVRGIENMKSLGQVVITSISAIPLFGSEFAYQGYGFLRPMLQSLKDLTAGKPSAEKLAILSELGVALESMTGSLLGKFAGDELPGTMSRIQRTYFKLNLLTPWTDRLRSSAALQFSHGLAVRRSLDFDGLRTVQPELVRTLEQYGIDAGKWDILREMQTKALDGRDYLTPEGIRSLPRELFDAYLSARGLKSTDARVRNLRTELETQLRSYFRDRVDYAVLQPDSKTRATWRQGTAAGTLQGEVLRSAAQFKSFPTAVFQRIWSREIFGRGADSFGQALRSGNGELRGMARIFLMTTLFGYGAMTVKHLIQGKEPRDIASLKTWLAAAMQGGALGAYGDFLFGEMRKSRGGGAIATMAGPVAGSMEQFFDIFGRVKEGDNYAAAGLRFLTSHVPGNNLFYIKPIWDQAIGYELFEMLSPGYIQRTIRRAEKEHGQKFWLRPGSLSII